MKQKGKQGFTLLEIIIVIIIIGVIAALALPRLFRTVEFSRSTEALNAFILFRGSMERCYLATSQTYVGCNFTSGAPAASNLDIEDPATAPNAHFTYAVASQSPTGYTVTATRNTIDGGNIASSITLTVAATGITKSGSGAFNSIR